MSNILSFFAVVTVTLVCGLQPVHGMSPKWDKQNVEDSDRLVLPVGAVCKAVDDSTPVPNAFAPTLNANSVGHITGIAQIIEVKASDPMNPNTFLGRLPGGQLLLVKDGRVHDDLHDGYRHNGCFYKDSCWHNGCFYKNCPFKDLSNVGIQKIKIQQYDVTLVISHAGGTQTFVAKNEIPVEAGMLSLISTTNPKNRIVLDYDNASVQAITSVATFQEALDTLLGLIPGNVPARFFSTSVAYSAFTISLATAVIATKPGIYYLNYEANSSTLKLDDGCGGVWTAPASEAYQCVSFANGISVVMGGCFDHTAIMSQVGLQVMD